MSDPANYLFVNPYRETEAVKAGKELHQMLPIRVSTVVPRNEIWWGREMPTQVEVDGLEVKVINRIEIIHKMIVG